MNVFSFVFFQVYGFIEGMGVYRTAPGACGEGLPSA